MKIIKYTRAYWLVLLHSAKCSLMATGQLQCQGCRGLFPIAMSSPNPSAWQFEDLKCWILTILFAHISHSTRITVSQQQIKMPVIYLLPAEVNHYLKMNYERVFKSSGSSNHEFSKENPPLYLLLQNKLPKLDISTASVKIHAINNRRRANCNKSRNNTPTTQ